MDEISVKEKLLINGIPVRCPHCLITDIEKCKGVEPYNEDYFICPKCDSTFPCHTS